MTQQALNTKAPKSEGCHEPSWAGSSGALTEEEDDDDVDDNDDDGGNDDDGDGD